MKKVISYICMILLSVLILCLILSFAIKDSILKTLSDSFVKQEISSYILDQVIDKLDNNFISRLGDDIKESPYIQNITDKFLDDIYLKLKNNKSDEIFDIDLDIENEINNIIDEEFSSFSYEFREFLKSELAKIDFDKISDDVIEYFTSEYKEEITSILKIYDIICSTNFKIIVLIVILILVLILIFINKFETIKYILMSTFISFILLFLLVLGINIYVKKLTNMYPGRTITINIDLFIISIVLLSFITILLFLIYFIPKKINKKMN